MIFSMFGFGDKDNNNEIKSVYTGSSASDDELSAASVDPVDPVSYAEPEPMKVKEQNKVDEVKTIIGSDTVITGTVKCRNDLEIYGTIIGNIECDCDVYMYGRVAGDIDCNNFYHNSGAVKGNITAYSDINIRRDGAVKGELKAMNIISDGKTKGNLVAEKVVDLQGNAVAVGDIQTAIFNMKDSVALNGTITLTTDIGSTDEVFETLFDF